MDWRVLLTPPLGGAENMALDEALMDRARSTTEAVFRVYTWNEPTLSFGRNQTACGAYDPATARARGISVVRRLTGGRALLHHREVTYSVTAPVEAGSSLRESYHRINRLLVTGLRQLGVPVTLASPTNRAPLPTAAPCFEQPAAGELVVNERKLVGSAQWRDEGAMLQHGSILVEDDQVMVAELSGNPRVQPPPAATLTEAMGRSPTIEEVAAALFDAVRSLECGTARELEVDFTLDQSMRHAMVRYNNDAWTWRR
jgi:lipoate-protein ligase A